jgi:hypothetical protein
MYKFHNINSKFTSLFKPMAYILFFNTKLKTYKKINVTNLVD